MPVYLISYDLLNKAMFGEYEDLIADLEALGARRVLFSEWMVRSDQSAMDLTKRVRQHIHDFDRVMVIEVNMANGAIANLMCKLDNL
jgi:hypothetical protein